MSKTEVSIRPERARERERERERKKGKEREREGDREAERETVCCQELSPPNSERLRYRLFKYVLIISSMKAVANFILTEPNLSTFSCWPNKP